MAFGTVLVASNSREAEDVMKNKAIDIAFLDAHVSAATAIDLAPELAAKGICIVFTSGYSRDELGDRLDEFAFLPKPYSFAQLVTALDETLSDQSGNLAAE
jgi:two-component SAPR family response regulator